METLKGAKHQTWAKVNEELETLFAEHKVSSKFKENLMSTLASLLEPKKVGGSAQNPPYEEDGIVYYFCRFHQVYEPKDNMVISNDKSKGYCKASIAKWTKLNTLRKKLESESAKALLSEDFELAKKKAQEAKEIHASLNLYETYDFTKDWENFNK
ncbi:MAG: hypothetical protein RBT33_00745 [Candidatus Dojkabacteria bacterium]|jgi:hypothetical protein|nr:hypothetical protein [Candidatus Dojkabacteria bacterium]